MKKLSFKSIISLLLVVVLCFSVVYVPGLSISASAADCGSGKHSFTQKDNQYKKSNATCTVPETYYYACSKCGMSSQFDTGVTYTKGTAKGHSVGSWVNVDPTCTDDGGKKQECSKCDYVYFVPDVGTALGHNIEIRSAGDGTHSKECTRVKCTFTKKENCTTVNVKCGVVSVCDICQKSYGGPVAHDLIKGNFG